MKDIKDILFDQSNKEDIILVDENGKQGQYAQVAVIPNEGKLYCILKPIDKIEGIADDEAVVFRIEESDKESILKCEDDELKAIEIFEKYYDLLEEAYKKKWKRK